jgi:hypothetical protein
MNSTVTDARRLGRLYVTGPALAEVFQEGVHSYAIVADPLPDDAQLLGVAHDLAHDILVLTFWSSVFPPVPDGLEPPALVPLIRCLERIPGPGVN